MKKLRLFVQKTIRIIGREGIITYQRQYTYIVSGQEYTFNTVEADSKPYKIIKYNPNNPNEARTYEGINTETKVIFFISLICLFSPIILKVFDNKNNVKFNEIKYKIIKVSKRNIIKIITGCFWIYIAISLLAILKEIFLKPNWNQIVIKYSQMEIIMECVIYILGRSCFKKFTCYFNIFWN